MLNLYLLLMKSPLSMMKFPWFMVKPSSLMDLDPTVPPGWPPRYLESHELLPFVRALLQVRLRSYGRFGICWYMLAKGDISIHQAYRRWVIAPFLTLLHVFLVWVCCLHFVGIANGHHYILFIYTWDSSCHSRSIRKPMSCKLTSPPFPHY